MAFALVSAGPVTNTLSPTFGQNTTAGNLLVAWVIGNSSNSSAPFSTAASGWTSAYASQFGGAFEWSAVFYKAGCGASETAPQFSMPNGNVQVCMLAEFSGGAVSSPVDQAASGSGSASQTAQCGSPDGHAGNLIVFAVGWNGSNTGGIITTSMVDGAGNSITPTAYSGTGSSTSFYYDFAWGVAQGTGASGDSATGSLSVFSGGASGIATFKPALKLSSLFMNSGIV